MVDFLKAFIFNLAIIYLLIVVRQVIVLLINLEAPTLPGKKNLDFRNAMEES